MALDGIFINFLVNEISEKLIGSKVDKVSVMDALHVQRRVTKVLLR